MVCAFSVREFSDSWLRRMGGWFWDLEVYERALSAHGRGTDPYYTGVLLPFVYHPVVLRLLALLDSIGSLRVVLIALTVGAVIWLSREVMYTTTHPQGGEAGSRSFGPMHYLVAFAMACAFGGVGVTACMSGNVSVTMHFAMMAALLRGGRPGGLFFRFLPFGLLVLCSLVKPFFLAYLAVPVLLYERRLTALACSFVVVALFGVLWYGFEVYWPGEYAHFQLNVVRLLSDQDPWYSFFYVFCALTGSRPLSLAAHCVMSVLMIVLVLRLFRQRFGRDVPFAPQLLVLYGVLTLASPRVKEYDLFPVLVGLFLALDLLTPLALRLILISVMLTLIPLPIVMGADAPHPPGFSPVASWQAFALLFLGVAFLWIMEPQQKPQVDVRMRA